MASERNDGGPCYPRSCDECSHNPPDCKVGQPGMSMRQRYKLAAMEITLTLNRTSGGHQPQDDSFASWVGELADAMLAEDAAWAKGQKEKSDAPKSV